MSAKRGIGKLLFALANPPRNGVLAAGTYAVIDYLRDPDSFFLDLTWPASPSEVVNTVAYNAEKWSEYVQGAASHLFPGAYIAAQVADDVMP
jgi:hypothetical protein